MNYGFTRYGKGRLHKLGPTPERREGLIAYCGRKVWSRASVSVGYRVCERCLIAGASFARQG